MTDGVRICPSCRASLIDEEGTKHKHSDTYRLEADFLWVRWWDGLWHKVPIPREVKRGYRPRGDEIEPSS